MVWRGVKCMPCEWRTGVAILQWGIQPPGSINEPGLWQRDLALPDGTNLTASSFRLFKQKQCWLERWRAEVRCCTIHLGRWPPDWLGRKCGDWIGKKLLQKSQKSIVHPPQFQPGSGSHCLSSLEQPYQPSLVRCNYMLLVFFCIAWWRPAQPGWNIAITYYCMLCEVLLTTLLLSTPRHHVPQTIHELIALYYS